MPGFERRTLTLAPGSECAAPAWDDALVVVTRGAIELEGVGGTTRRFGPGDLIWLRGVPLRALRNHGPDAAVLVAVSRRR
jgi:hypothetical protein